MEYFAEGVQSYFNSEGKGIEASGPPGGDGNVNHVNTREKLLYYDFQEIYFIYYRLYHIAYTTKQIFDGTVPS